MKHEIAVLGFVFEKEDCFGVGCGMGVPVSQRSLST